MVTAQPTPAYAIVPGNCLEILSSFGDETVDSIVTDPLEGFTAVAIELGGPEGTPEHHYPAMIQQRADRALAEIAARPTPETAQEEESIPA